MEYQNLEPISNGLLKNHIGLFEYILILNEINNHCRFKESSDSVDKLW